MLSPVSLCCLFVLGGLSKRYAISYALCWENPILTKISELSQMIYYDFFSLRSGVCLTLVLFRGLPSLVCCSSYNGIREYLLSIITRLLTS